MAITRVWIEEGCIFVVFQSQKISCLS